MQPTFMARILLVAALATAQGCATEDAEEAASGAAAVSTPRTAEEQAAEARLDDLRAALDSATPADFGQIPVAVRPHIDKALAFFSEADSDQGARAYSFVTSAKKSYVIETHPAQSARLVTLYVYDAVYGDKSLAHLTDERTPRPLGRCSEPAAGAPLRCQTVAQGALLYGDGAK